LAHEIWQIDVVGRPQTERKKLTKRNSTETVVGFGFNMHHQWQRMQRNWKEYVIFKTFMNI